MATTLFLAKMLGLFFIITGLAALLTRKHFIHVVKDMFKNTFNTFLFGVLLLVIGLLIILQHNVWHGALNIVVSLVGWYIVLEAVCYLFIPRKAMKKAMKLMKYKGFYYFGMLLDLILGIYLICAGFGIKF